MLCGPQFKTIQCEIWKFRVLLAINTLFAIGASAFIFLMLPYAHGVLCDGERNLGRVCSELSTIEYAATALAPIAISFVFVVLSFGLKRVSLGAAISWLAVPPLLLSGWAIFVALG
jgi:hypothetical protein